MRRGWVLAGLLLFGPAGPAAARVWEAGPDAALHSLSEAVAKAADGDTIRLAAGEYFDCALVPQRDLVIEGAGPATVITDKVCVGKGLLVAQGDNLVVRNLTLARARVPDLNGAGIRLEAQGLLAEHVVFENDEVGVLAGQGGAGAVVIRDCTFQHGGVAGDRPGAALMIGSVARLLVERSTFTDVKGGQISSAAALTELVGDRIETGVEPGGGPAVTMAGERLVLRDTVVVVGPNPPPRRAAVLAMGGAVEARGNRMENRTGQPLTFVLDWTQGRTVLAGNVIGAGDSESSSAGVLRHRAGGAARAVLADLRSAGGAFKQAAKRMLGR